MLTRYIKALCPQQAIDEFTPDAWHDVLAELNFEVARYAAMRIAHRQPFISPSELITEAHLDKVRKPYERTVAEAIAESSERELSAAPAVPPTPEYLSAKAEMEAALRRRAEEAALYDRAAERRAKAWLDYKLTSKLPPDVPQNTATPSRWTPLPDDPPELRAWLACREGE